MGAIDIIIIAIIAVWFAAAVAYLTVSHVKRKKSGGCCCGSCSSCSGCCGCDKKSKD